MKLFIGAKVHIWTEGSRTLMKITNNRGGILDSLDSFGESFTILSDTENGMNCDIKMEVKGLNSYE